MASAEAVRVGRWSLEQQHVMPDAAADVEDAGALMGELEATEGARSPGRGPSRRMRSWATAGCQGRRSRSVKTKANVADRTALSRIFVERLLISVEATSALASCEISAPLLGAVKPGGTAPNSR